MTKRIVIIGGGPAGYEAALVGAAYGAQITVVDSDGMGGAAVLFDCVPSKSFIAATGIRTEMRRAEAMGLDTQGSDLKLSLTEINARVKSLAQAQSNDVRAQLEREDIRMVAGYARLADSQPGMTEHTIIVTDADGAEETLQADVVLIATGGSPRILPAAQPDGERILTWRQIYDLEQLPEHLIVVGSGVTGAELVSAYTELGVKVTMVSSRDRILPHEDEDAAIVLEKVLFERGVELVKEARADLVERTETGVRVEMSDGRVVEGSHALMCVGMIPNTAGLGLEEAGVELTRSGHIKVDRVSRTSAPGIYAAGDCSDLFPLASVAAMQGRVAMYHCLGEGVTPIRLKTVASAVFTRPEIATVGVSHAEIEAGTVNARVIVYPLTGNPRAKMQSLRYGFVKVFCRPSSGIVIGGVVVAPSASELILPIAMAVTNKLTVDEIASCFSVYPSLSGTVVEASRRLIRHDEIN